MLLRRRGRPKAHEMALMARVKAHGMALMVLLGIALAKGAETSV